MNKFNPVPDQFEIFIFWADLNLYVDSNLLIREIIIIMKGQTKYICEHEGCGKEYSTKFALRRHVHTHSGLKAFGCDLCGKRFSLEQYLQEHMYVHTKAKPFVCGINGCTDAFR